LLNINNSENLIFKLSNITEDEQLSNIDVSFHLVKKQREADDQYQTLEIELAPDVKKWIRKNIIKSLIDLKHDNNVFNVGDYNHEISINDKIAKFSLNTVTDMLDKKIKLISSLRRSDTEYPEKQTNFQIVKLTFEEHMAYFGYYRGIKRNTSRTRKRMAFKNTNQFQFMDDTTIIDIG